MLIMRQKKLTNQLHASAPAYEAPSLMVAELSSEGVLCGSIRDIDNFEVLPEQDW